MLDLDEAVARWRKQFAASDSCSADELDELESHLREDIAARIAAGMSAEQALAVAVARIGDPELVCNEFTCSRSVDKMDSAVLKIHSAVVGLLCLASMWLGCSFSLQRGDPLLAAHVAILTLGYTALVLLGVLGSYAVLRSVMKTENPEWSLALGRHLSRHLGVAVLACFAGTLLGGWWSELQTGAFWGGSFRENGALAVTLSALTAWLIVGQYSLRSSLLGQLCLFLGVGVEIAWLGPACYLEQFNPTLFAIGGSIVVVQCLLAGLPLLSARGYEGLRPQGR